MPTGINPLKNIGNGLAPDDGSGDTLRSGAQVINANAVAIAQAINNLGASQAAGTTSYLTLAALNDDLTPADGVVAYVTNDPTTANNGWYRKNGASGTGSWGATVNPVSNALTAALGNPAGFQQAGAGAVLRTYQDKARETRSIQDFGGKPDGGVTDNSVAFAKAKAAGVKRLTFPYGELAYGFAGTTGIDITNMELVGDGLSTVLDFRACTSAYPVSSAGALTAIPALASDVSKLAPPKLIFSAPPGLATNDVVVIHNPTNYSWSGYRAYYQAGEYCEVARVSGSEAILKSSLWDSYASAAVNVYKMTPASCVLRNMTVLGGPTATALINISLNIAPLLDNVAVYALGGGGVNFDRCYKPAMNPVVVNNNSTGMPTSDVYGIVISNCQGARIKGGSAYAPWTATEFGGTGAVGCVPNRDCTYAGMIIGSDSSQDGPHGAGMHGNSELCGYIDCTIYNNASMGGADALLRGCTIYGLPTGQIISAGEIIGGLYDISNCKLRGYGTDPQSIGRGYVDFGGNSNSISAWTSRDLTVSLQNSSIEVAAAGATSSLVKIINSGATTTKVNVDINGLRVKSNTSLNTLVMGTINSAVALSDFIKVDNVSGLPASSSLANLYSYMNMPLKIQRQVILTPFTTLADSKLFPAVQSFPWTYPRTPAVTVTVGNSASAPNIAGKAVSPFVRFVNNATVQAAAITSDGSSVTAGVTVNFTQVAEINEC